MFQVTWQREWLLCHLKVSQVTHIVVAHYNTFSFFFFFPNAASNHDRTSKKTCAGPSDLCTINVSSLHCMMHLHRRRRRYGRYGVRHISRLGSATPLLRALLTSSEGPPPDEATTLRGLTAYRTNARSCARGFCKL